MSADDAQDRSRFSGVASLLGVGVGGVALFAALAHRQGVGADADPASPSEAPPFDGVPPTNDIEALARVITSEVDSYSLKERLVVAWTVRNRAHRRRTSIVNLVCSPTCGRCCKGRPFSSYRAPSAKALELARDILEQPASEDPTQGAVAFLEPALEDWLATHGDPRPRRTADQVRAQWIADGQKRLGTVGRIELWS